MRFIDMSPVRAQAARERGLLTPLDDLRILGIHLKHSIKFRLHKKPKGAESYDEAAEIAKFARECTHHGLNWHNQPRNTMAQEQYSESASSVAAEPKKAAHVHFADEEDQHSPTLSQKKPLPSNGEVESIMRRWLDPNDEAEPGEYFQHACPVTYSYLMDIVHGERLNDGVNDWVTRTAALKEIDNARLPMQDASGTDDTMRHDLQAINVLYEIIEGMKVYGQPPWEGLERY